MSEPLPSFTFGKAQRFFGLARPTSLSRIDPSPVTSVRDPCRKSGLALSSHHHHDVARCSSLEEEVCTAAAAGQQGGAHESCLEDTWMFSTRASAQMPRLPVQLAAVQVNHGLLDEVRAWRLGWTTGLL